MENKKYFAFLNRDTQKDIEDVRTYARFGYANGYVAIPPGHPFNGKDFNDIDISVHGGVTYAETIEDTVGNNWGSIECIGFDSIDEIPSGYFVLGFDTMHFGDDSTLDREWCIMETKNLLEELKRIGSLSR